MQIAMTPIGVFHTTETHIPRHWSISNVQGDMVIEEKYQAGLKDIHPGQKVVVIFHFHKSPAFQSEHLIQTPKHRNQQMGIFSICSPLRPNPIGLSVLEVMAINKNVITVTHADMIDQTPILDIKPYITGASESSGQN